MWTAGEVRTSLGLAPCQGMPTPHNHTIGHYNSNNFLGTKTAHSHQHYVPAEFDLDIFDVDKSIGTHALPFLQKPFSVS
jgi:hypothetical protein